MSVRKLSVLMGLAFVLAALVVGCTLNTGDTQTVLNNSNSPSGVGPSPGASPAAPNCLPIEGVRVTLKGKGGTTSFPINSDEALDATPMDSRGPAPYECHGHDVTWLAEGPALCTITGSGFTPMIRCATPGGIKVTATVGSPGGIGVASFTAN